MKKMLLIFFIYFPVILLGKIYHPSTPNPPTSTESNINIGHNATLRITGASTWFSDVYSTDQIEIMPPWGDIWESIFNEPFDQYSNHFIFKGGTSLGVEDAMDLPDVFMVKNAYPNPFNPSTTIKYAIPDIKAYENVNIQIFDILGRLVCTLEDNKIMAGWHSVVWNGTDKFGHQAPSGAYLVRIIAGKEIKNKKIMYFR